MKQELIDYVMNLTDEQIAKLADHLPRLIALAHY